jgi:trehalose 6-phosphate phosphatase
MKHLLSEDGRAVLRRFATPGTLLGLDYDGTLAPIKTDPADALLPATTHRRLASVARVFPTVIISGRAAGDIRNLVQGIEAIHVVGNHGAEGSSVISAELAGRVAAWRERLAGTLGPLQGVAVEDKVYSLSLHYRRSTDREGARDAILDAVKGLEGARIVGGKAVINVLLQEAPNKGTALLLACSRAGCGRAIFVGDDATDEDVFALHLPRQILGVRVGHHARSGADYYLRDRSEVDELLALALDYRAAAPDTSSMPV